MKAIALFSGGLDSSLAVKAVVDQGVEVLAVFFYIPFDRRDEGALADLARRVVEQLGAEFRLVRFGAEYLEMFRNPKFGYGSNFNPCIDCKILMLKYAKRMMQETGASFLVSGEVVGQRPMSQGAQTLKQIENEAGVAGLLLRPLCAKLLEPTVPEKQGWVKREELYDFSGRGRNNQIKLAAKLGVKEYPWPGGGCPLTEPSFCARVKDLLDHDGLNMDNVPLLKVGRHFRLNPELKFAVGRNQDDNDVLEKLAQEDDAMFSPKEVAGPTGLLRGRMREEDKLECCRIIARYAKHSGPMDVIVKYKGKEEIVKVEVDPNIKIESLIDGGRRE